MATHEFAIKREELNSGKVILTPMCRRATILNKLPIFNNPWQRIVEIYGNYVLMELDFVPELTYEQCEEHINGYKQKLIEFKEGEVAETIILKIEEEVEEKIEKEESSSNTQYNMSPA